MNKCTLVVMGPGGVGKTALILQFVSGHFLEDYDPTIEDLYEKKVDVDGSSILLEILDTAGQDEYSAMRDQFIMTGEVFILVYATDNLRSFTDMHIWKGQIDRVKAGTSSPIVLVGNKSDLPRKEVTTQQGEQLARQWGCPFFETSAKASHNVQEIFLEIVRERERKQPSVKPPRKHNCCVCL